VSNLDGLPSVNMSLIFRRTCRSGFVPLWCSRFC
jgi:hypothetical protein